jgi:excisionase family DNA binding protein
MATNATPSPAAPKQFWTVYELADHVGLSRQMIYKLVSGGHLQETRPPGCRRLLLRDEHVQAWLTAGPTS